MKSVKQIGAESETPSTEQSRKWSQLSLSVLVKMTMRQRPIGQPLSSAINTSKLIRRPRRRELSASLRCLYVLSHITFVLITSGMNDDSQREKKTNVKLFPLSGSFLCPFYKEIILSVVGRWFLYFCETESGRNETIQTNNNKIRSLTLLGDVFILHFVERI